MKKVVWLILLVAASCETQFAQNQSLNELRRLFNYDQNAPLDVKEVAVISRDRIRIHDITYASPKGGRVTAYLVEPAEKSRHAGIVDCDPAGRFGRANFSGRARRPPTSAGESDGLSYCV